MSPTPLTQAGWACSLWWPGCACCPLEACTVGEAPLPPAPPRQRPALRPANAAYGAVLQRRAVTSRLDTPPRSSSRIRRSTAAGRHLPLYAAAALCMRADHGPARRRRRPAQRPQQTHALLERPACDAASTTSPARAGEQSVCGCRTMGRLGGVAKRFEHVWLQVVRQLIMRRNLQCRDGAQSSLLAVTARCDTEDSRSGCGWRASGCQHPPANSRRSVVGQRTRARNGVDQRSLSGSDTVTTAKGNIWGTSRFLRSTRTQTAISTERTVH